MRCSILERQKMVKLFKHAFSIFAIKQNSILSAASIIMMAVALSRVLGLIRDWLLVTRFNVQELGVYIAAFRIPNLIFELLVMGAFTSAFIPVFTTYLDTKGREESFKIASSVINIGLIIFAVSTLFLIIFSEEISRLIAPGFNKDEITLMSNFTRIIGIAQVFPLIIGTFFTGILQSFRNFLVPAIAPIVYNLGIIFGIIFLSPILGLYGPVWGVVIGAFLFTLIQVPLIISLGYKHSFKLGLASPATREIGRLMLPRTVGLGISQIDATIDLTLSTLISPAAVTIFNYAQHLQQVPVGIFGASIAQATLPALSSSFAQKKDDEFKKVFTNSFHQILFLVIPISAILIVLRLPIVRLVFGIRSLLDLPTTLEISKTLSLFSISIFAQALVHLVTRGFYALHDTKTPVVVGAISVVINSLLSIIFIKFYYLGVWALGLSTSIASIFHLTLLLFLFDKKIGKFDRGELILPIIKIFLCGMVTGVALYIPVKLLDQLVFDTTRTINLIMLTSISAFVGLSVYLFLAWFLEIPQATVILKILKKDKVLKRGFVLDTTQEVDNIQEAKL